MKFSPWVSPTRNFGYTFFHYIYHKILAADWLNTITQRFNCFTKKTRLKTDKTAWESRCKWSLTFGRLPIQTLFLTQFSCRKNKRKQFWCALSCIKLTWHSRRVNFFIKIDRSRIPLAPSKLSCEILNYVELSNNLFYKILNFIFFRSR